MRRAVAVAWFNIIWGFTRVSLVMLKIQWKDAVPSRLWAMLGTTPAAKVVTIPPPAVIMVVWNQGPMLPVFVPPFMRAGAMGFMILLLRHLMHPVFII